MSHFSTITTTIKDRDLLVKSLQVLGHEVEENILLDNPINHQHEQVEVEVAINNDIGFKWNGSEYELVAELDAWDLDVPVQRFIDKLTQQYAEQTVLAKIEEQGFVVEQRNTTDGTVELVVGRWT
tara:strand:- start:658 stop:1032 length:375 start_codon:yes stop_codon:yes gene_type:complete